MPDTLLSLLEQRARRTPDAPAVEYDGTALTQAELHAWAGRLARVLAAGGVGPESVVAVAVPRSAELIVALLAVLKAGAAYLPLDTSYPKARIEAMVADAEPVRVLRPADVTAARTGSVPDVEPVAPTPGDAAYVIYTSGTTNRPKGVVVTHDAIARRLVAVRAEHAFRPDDRILQITPASFDPSVVDIFFTLAEGATLVMAPPAAHTDPELCARLVRDERITVVRFVPSVLPLFLDAYLAHGPGGPLRMVVSEGEALPTGLANRFLAALDIPLYNDYGPTEAAVGVSYLRCAPSADTGVVPIGPPLGEVGMRVLDERLRPVDIGEIGELHLSGPQLARGYLGRPGMTADRFVADPFGEPGARMYRTGDLVRRRADGAFDCLGRVDHQVKFNGVRVELAEITGVVASHPRVRQAAVLVRARGTGSPILVAYVAPTVDGGPDPAELRTHCAAVLPPMLVPSAVVSLAALPLLPNGKLDRDALPVPTAAGTGTVASAPPLVALLCDLFAEVTGVPEVGPDDDFLALGGQSLAAGRLVGRLRAVASVELPVRAVLEAPTPALLAARVAAATGEVRPRPTRAPATGRPAPSHAQRRLWFLEQQGDSSAAYNVPVAIRLSGSPDPVVLAAALADLAGRHETLRTLLPDHDGEPWQHVLPPAPVDVPVSSCDEDGLADALRTEVCRPFDLVTRPPLRARRFVLPDGDTVLLLVVHHTAVDGLSAQVLLTDLADAYTARAAGTALTRPEPPLRYTDYAVWQDALLAPADQEGTLHRQLAFWRRTLADLPAEIALPTDRPRPETPTGRADTVPVTIDADLHAALLDLARATGTTTFMMLRTALAALLHRMGAGTDVPLGGVVSGRVDEALTDLVGLFLNTVVLRTDLYGDPSFRALLGRVRTADLAVLAHQDVPFDRVVEEVNPPRAAGRHPLFQVMVVQNTLDVVPPFAGLTGRVLPVETGIARFDLTLDVVETRGDAGTPTGVHGTLRFATDRFHRATAEALAGRLVRVLRAAVIDPDAPVSATDLLAPDERPASPAPRSTVPGGTVHGRIADRARSHPTAVALRLGDDALTYGELDARANRLARRLVAGGVRRGDVVGVCLERGFPLVVALLAVLKAGAAYTALDVDFPVPRLVSVLDRAGVRAVLADRHRCPDLAAPGRWCVDPADAVDVPASPAVPTGPDDAACLMFTSGSTGTPKAVLAPHRALVASLTDQEFVDFGPGQVYLQSAPVSWDAFARQLFGPLLAGGTCVLQPGQRPDPGRMADAVRRHGVTVLDAAGSLFNHLWDEYPDVFARLDRAMTGGEPASPAHVRALLARYPHVRVVNGYGPVESMGYSTWFPIEHGWHTDGVPIGFPVAHKRIHVLDDRLRAVPPGVTGEVYVAGAGLAIGYHGAPADTAVRFVADPHGAPGDRMYRTGDLGRFGSAGALEYLGRTDDQVKIRGFRVDPAEIRSAVAAHPSVRRAEIVVRGKDRLVAYVVADGVTEADLRAHATSRLPTHLVPAAFVVLAELPTTATGKVDRQALPDPTPTTTPAGRPPVTDTEKVLCALFGELLDVPTVSLDDDFFALGGHSLLVMRLISRTRTALRAELSVKDVFEGPTVAVLAGRLARPGATRPELRPRPVLKEMS
ncbi:MAG TPA: amino acid adenylation domain-containing protein [Pseudonocardiaceae bacterium]